MILKKNFSKEEKMMLQGAITAIVTPFDEKGNIDEKALRKLVNFQIENSISGIVPCGTTGESPTLTYEEHNQAINIVIDEARGRVPVLAGTGSNSTDEAILKKGFMHISLLLPKQLICR
jgi:4-hydroxy-tetrahydrodipicolinate synthase